MRPVFRVSDHCLIDQPTYLLAFEYKGPVVARVLRLLYRADPRMHFTGPFGLAWRAFGVTRSTKNPNMCTL